MRGKRAISFPGVVAASAALWTVVACGREAPPPQEPPRPVRTVTVGSRNVVNERRLAGVAKAAIEARLSFRVGGTVDRLSVAVGDVVRQGQPMARIDPTDYELRVEQAEAALAQARALLRRADADYERVRALYESNNASKSELDAGRAAAESAQAQVEAGAKQLEQARQQLAYTRLAAPFAGAVASVDVEVNENVRSGQQIFLLTGGEGIDVEVAVPEGLISRVEVGQQVWAEFPALRGRRFRGAVKEVGVAVTGASPTFQVVVRLEQEAPEVRSGMAAEVTFPLERGDGDRIVVPAVSVGEDRQGRFVFVLEPQGEGEGVVRRRAVTVGQPTEALNGIEILDGLAEGDVVVTAGVRSLSDGMRVRVVEGNGDGV
jgi:membrane fusion protein, multidrug efflux system